jgi:hypothetical protein
LSAATPASAQDRPQRVPDWDRSYEAPAPKQYKVDAKTLYGVGISVRYFSAAGDLLEKGTASAGAGYPNKCFLNDEGSELTLSNGFVRHYTARGFSLEAICFAVSAGGWIKYDVETGKPLRTANAYLIDIPDCFKNGVPFLECTYNFEHQFGLKATEANRTKIRERAVAADKEIRSLIEDGKFSQNCTCQDLEVRARKLGTGARQTQIADLFMRGSRGSGAPVPKRFTCRVETVPECAQKLLPGRSLAGWKMAEVFEGVAFDGTLLKGFTDYGPFDISPQHPRGYAYQIGHPEGDDDRPFLELAPGTKLGVAE